MLGIKSHSTPKGSSSAENAALTTSYTYGTTTYTCYVYKTVGATGKFRIFNKPATCDIFVVGGGGSGGGGNASNHGSGGGAGGVIWRPNKSLDPGEYTITVAATAAYPTGTDHGTQGNNSEFGTGGSYILQALGGGKGSGATSNKVGFAGGCGSGTGRDGNGVAAGATTQASAAGGHADSRTYGFGSAGGLAPRPSCGSAGGGGGAGQAGQAGGYDCQYGNLSRHSWGGNGASAFVSGTSGANNGNAAETTKFLEVCEAGVGHSDGKRYIAGGGGGSFEASYVYDMASGGLGGGGRGASRYGGADLRGTDGILNTGGGGGSGQSHQSGNVGGYGASGIVIVRVHQ